MHRSCIKLKSAPSKTTYSFDGEAPSNVKGSCTHQAIWSLIKFDEMHKGGTNTQGLHNNPIGLCKALKTEAECTDAKYSQYCQWVSKFDVLPHKGCIDGDKIGSTHTNIATALDCEKKCRAEETCILFAYGYPGKGSEKECILYKYGTCLESPVAKQDWDLYRFIPVVTKSRLPNKCNYVQFYNGPTKKFTVKKKCCTNSFYLNPDPNTPVYKPLDECAQWCRDDPACREFFHTTGGNNYCMKLRPGCTDFCGNTDFMYTIGPNPNWQHMDHCNKQTTKSTCEPPARELVANKYCGGGSYITDKGTMEKDACWALCAADADCEYIQWGKVEQKSTDKLCFLLKKGCEGSYIAN